MFRSAQSMLKVEVVNKTFCYISFFKIHEEITVFWKWNDQNTSLNSTYYICAGSGRKKEKKI